MTTSPQQLPFLIMVLVISKQVRQEDHALREEDMYVMMFVGQGGCAKRLSQPPISVRPSISVICP